MSATTTVKPDDLQRKPELAKAEEQLRQQKLDEQQERLREQNWWFYTVMDLDKVKSKKTQEKKLKVVRENVATALKEDETQQKHDVAEAKYEARYKDRLNRSEDKLTELKSYLPAAAPLIKKFEDAHKEAKRLLDADKTAWKEAFDALHVVSVSDAIGDADKLWEAGEKNARKAAPAFFKAVEAAKQTLADSRGLLSVEAYEAFNARVDGIAGALCQTPAPDGTAVSTASKDLTKFEKDLEKAAKQASDHKARAERLQRDVPKLLDAAKNIVAPFGGFTDTDLAAFQRQLTSADTNIGFRDFAAGAQMLAGLRTQIEAKRDGIVAAAGKAEEDWRKESPGIGDLLDRADTLAADTKLPQAIRTAAAEASQRVSALASVTPGKDPTFAAALAECLALKAEVKLLEATAADAPAFVQGLDEADKRIRALIDQAAKAIQAVPAALTKANGGKDLDTARVTTPLNDTLSEILEAWEGLLQSAVSIEELSETATSAELQKLLSDIDSTVTAGLDDTVADIVLAPAREAYAIEREKALGTAKSIMSLNPEDGANLLETIESADSAVNAADTPETILELAESLRKLALADAGRAGSNELGIAALQQALRDKLREVPNLISTLQGAVNSKKDATEQKPFIALLDTVTTEYETLLALADSRQSKLLNQAFDEADALIAQIGVATDAVKGKTGKTDQTFATAQKLIDGYSKRLAKDDVQTYALATATELSDVATGFSKDFGKVLVAKLFVDLEALGKKVDAVELKAQQGKQQAARFEELIKVQKKRMDEAPFKTDSPDYAAATKLRLDKILSDARFEDGLEPAKAEFVRLLQELDDAEKSPTNLLGQRVDLVAKQDEALEVKRKGELDQAKWEGDLKVVEKQLNAAKSGEVDSDEIAGMRTMFNECKTAIEKSKQYADGREQLRAITKRLSLLEANPYGLVISARNKLPQATARVKGEIMRFSKALADVTSALNKLSEADLPATDKKTVQAQLAALRGLFNPAAFDKAVPIVAAQKTERNKRAAARETALRDVRRMMGYVDNDYRIQVLGKLKALGETPIKGDMMSVLSGLKLGLLDLENNLLVSMAK